MDKSRLRNRATAPKVKDRDYYRGPTSWKLKEWQLSAVLSSHRYPTTRIFFWPENIISDIHENHEQIKTPESGYCFQSQG